MGNLHGQTSIPGSDGAEANTSPLVSVIVLNYNGLTWLSRCVESLRAQTCVDRIEVIIADNASTDGSDREAERLLAGWSNGRFLQNGANLGYCEGNNRGASVARGKYLLFLNNDTWLEKDCLERLLVTVDKLQADAASPLVCDYSDDTFQTIGAAGFDLLGYLSTTPSLDGPRPILAAPGCALLIRAEVFRFLGGFDREFFMYADETDLGWRTAICGFTTVTVPEARLHHRSAAKANPLGGTKVIEFRTNEMVRFFVTRNSLLVVLKSARHVLLALVALQLLCVLLEAVAVLLLVRRWSTVSEVYLGALADCWRLRHHALRERRRLRSLRRRGDLWMLRFLRLPFGRWNEVRRLARQGPPTIDGFPS